MPASRRAGSEQNRTDKKRHSLDHLLPSYKPSTTAVTHKNSPKSPRILSNKSPIQQQKANAKFKKMPTKKNHPPQKPAARTSRRGQPLDPAVAAFFDPKTSVTAELLSPGGGGAGGATFSLKKKKKSSSSTTTKKNNDKKNKPLQVKKTVATKVLAPRGGAPAKKKKTPAKRGGRAAPAAKKTAVPKAPQNSTQYIMAERRRKSKPERPIKSLTSPRAERLASPGVPPKSNLNMFGSMMPQAMKEDEEEMDDGEDLQELIGDIFNEKPVVVAAKRKVGNTSGQGGKNTKSNAESNLYDAQNTLIESQAKRIGELQNEIIRLKMKLRDFEDEKMMADSNASQRLMERMKGLFKF